MLILIFYTMKNLSWLIFMVLLAKWTKFYPSLIFLFVTVFRHMFRSIMKMTAGFSLLTGLSRSLDSNFDFSWQFWHLEPSCGKFEFMVSRPRGLYQCCKSWGRQIWASCSWKCHILWLTFISTEVSFQKHYSTFINFVQFFFS